MTDKQDKQTHEALKELLKKKGERHTVSDDFEREALEGFAMYSNDDETLSSKEQLDERIYSEVFAKKENSSRVLYWAAAAALVLMIGFTVYLVQVDPLGQTKDLAVSPPAPTAENARDIAPLPPAEANKDADPGNATSIKGTPVFREKKTKEGTTFYDNASSTGSQIGDSENEESMAAVSSIQEDIKMVQPATRDEVIEQMPAPKNTAAANQPASAHSAPVLSGAGATAGAPEVEITSEKSSRSKKAESRSEKVGPVTCSYGGGEKALHKEIKRLLKEKNILAKFDATLFVNKLGKVEKVVVDSPFSLSVPEQLQVIEVLKTLEGFVFKSPPSNAELSAYTLEFRP